MRFAIDGHPRPSVGDDLHLGGVYMFISLDEMGGEDGAEELRGSNGMLFRHDVGSLLHCIGSDYDAVVGFGIAILVSLRLNVPCQSIPSRCFYIALK